MKIRDNTKPALEGNFKLYISKNKGPWKLDYEDHNLVVNKASEILRDLMFGEDNKIITKIKFGDMNLSATDNLITVEQPLPTDTAMVNPQYEKEVSKVKTTYEDSPAIAYSVTLTEDEFNGSGTKIITEYGLFNDSDELFAKKNRAAVFKDNETALQFVWTIVFN